MSPINEVSFSDLLPYRIKPTDDNYVQPDGRCIGSLVLRQLHKFSNQFTFSDHPAIGSWRDLGLRLSGG